MEKLPTDEKIKEIIDTGTYFDSLTIDEKAVGIYEYSAKAMWNTDTYIIFSGTYNSKTSEFRWMIRYNNYRVLSLDYEIGGHHNPDCSNVGAVHLHRWNNPKDKEKFADDMTDVVPPNALQGLHWFLKKFNIFLKEYPKSLPDYNSQRRLCT